MTIDDGHAPAVPPPSATGAAVAPPAIAASPPAAAQQQQQQQQGGKPSRQQLKKEKKKKTKPGGVEELLALTCRALLPSETYEALLASEAVAQTARQARNKAQELWPTSPGSEVVVRVEKLSAHGDGLGVLLHPETGERERVVVLPWALEGELVKAHLYAHLEGGVSHGQVLELVEKSEWRELEEGEVVREVERREGGEKQLEEVRKKWGRRVQCRYFGTCSGCQYQPLSYSRQLLIKQSVVHSAYLSFSGLPSSSLPSIGPTLPSPQQYSYRTKLTPHFQGPPKGKGKEWEVTIGFEEKGRTKVLDIEECVIATGVINQALPEERKKVKDNFSSYKRGATLLLRDSLPPLPPSSSSSSSSSPATPSSPSTEKHLCLTSHHSTVHERIGIYSFEQVAGSFFQNNASILGGLMEWLMGWLGDARERRLRKKEVVVLEQEQEEEHYLVDAYCGSGLFALSLSPLFTHVLGIEIDSKSVSWATSNALKNGLASKASFVAGSAERIFESIPPEWKGGRTTVVIDPPRKGCDQEFLEQLLKFRPGTIVYVSCNVHTQARDVGWLVRESHGRSLSSAAGGEGGGKRGGGGYILKEVRAADFFVQTHHAEGVAMLEWEDDGV